MNPAGIVADVIFGLQAGRAVATILVVMHHATLGSERFYGSEPAFGGFWRFGRIGVDFFFVLSGFIIFWVHSDDSPGSRNLKTFAIKRLMRIYPPFLPVSLMLLCLYAGFPDVSAGNRDISILTSVFLIPSKGSPALSVSWTLIHELLFYTVFSLFYVAGIRLLTFGLALWALTICIFSSRVESQFVAFVLSPYNLQFLMGVVVAFVCKISPAKMYWLFLGSGLLTVYVALNEFAAMNCSPLFVRSYLGLTFSCLVFGLYAIEERIVYPRALMTLGAASYSIYLVHDPAMSVLNRLIPRIKLMSSLPSEFTWIAISVIAALTGYAYYLAWERPVLRLMRRISASPNSQ